MESSKRGRKIQNQQSASGGHDDLPSMAGGENAAPVCREPGRMQSGAPKKRSNPFNCWSPGALSSPGSSVEPPLGLPLRRNGGR